MKKWYVVYTKTRMERLASQNLQNQGFETYLPTVELVKRFRKKNALYIEALFPGYMFIFIDFEKDNTASIRSTRGVKKLLGFNCLPIAVPTEFIRELQHTEQHRVIGDSVLINSLKPGDLVEVLDGPFIGFIGEIQRIPSKQRVCILMGILGKENWLELNSKDVEQISG